MIYITEKRYSKKHTDYRGIFENLQGHEDMKHLVGNRSLMIYGPCLVIEGASLEIVDNFERDLKTKGGLIAEFSYLDDWHRPIYSLKMETERVITICFLEEGIADGKPMYSYTSEGEPNCPLIEEYQVEVIK
ncbi:MAG: hypothetical protein WC656_01365 [Sulfurimonas sp.]|jgi:hypothetical protein